MIYYMCTVGARWHVGILFGVSIRGVLLHYVTQQSESMGYGISESAKRFVNDLLGCKTRWI